MVKEGLGYTLKNYDPCFNYNSDRFCCSKQGAQFRQNIIASQCPGMKHPTDYTTPSNYDQNDIRPLWLQQTGIMDPKPYEMTPQSNWFIWCGKMPCSLDQKGVPCQANMPYCTRGSGC